jgi:hypothetical protein
LAAGARMRLGDRVGARCERLVQPDDHIQEQIPEADHEHFKIMRMDGDERRGRLSSFVLGGLVGASAALAAARRRRGHAGAERRTPQGLEAFEEAPCYREIVERERLEEARLGDQQ